MEAVAIEDVRERSTELIEKLANVWEASVRATHGFLSEQDRGALRPDVVAALGGVAQLAVVREDGAPIAFAGAGGGKLEMLFAAPEAQGRGVGRALLAHSVDRWDVHRLDVNEQNPRALGFYRHAGFAVVARSSADGAGRPFPLLHLARADGIRARMSSGLWFNPDDPLLVSDHRHAQEIMRRFNADLSLDEHGRRALVRDLFGACGAGSEVSPGAQVDYGYHTFVGKRCFFNYGCTFLDGAPIVFGDGVMVGPHVVFATPTHPLLACERLIRSDADADPHAFERSLPIVVGDDVWIASGVTVGPGVTIGDGAVIGAGSVVTKDVPPRMLAYGNPCRPIRALTDVDAVGEALASEGLLR